MDVRKIVPQGYESHEQRNEQLFLIPSHVRSPFVRSSATCCEYKSLNFMNEH